MSRPLQELHNGDMQPAAKPASSSTTNRVDDMDTDGEIDVDDCDDREYRPSSGVGNNSERLNMTGVHLYKTVILLVQLLLRW